MTTCPRAWEVEAVRDGRLTGRARDAHDGHVRACAPCAADSKALEAMARGLREVACNGVDEMAMRRIRNRVLEVVDAEQTGRVRTGRRGWGRAAGGLVLALTVALVAFFFSWRARSGPTVEAQAPAHEALRSPEAPSAASSIVMARVETSVVVSASDTTRYTRATDGTVERFDLRDGTLRLHVQRPVEGRRVVVSVPDGEIEDIGTVFEVVVTDGHLERVDVDEGRVVVRLLDRAPVTVGAGTSWKRSTTAKAKKGLDRGAGPGASASTRSTTTAPAPDEREDVAYLEVLRLLREGRDADARAAASQYLSDFPAGFRRVEMDRVAKGQRQR